eukprot:TRINITY_DN48758_c1_g1_i1.p1 TRINITY_DN48758_c1_g1~~TRINITY_DN48758_c1_g1_i1.p1  ORF type:complete len:286 (-),score=76.03 TRINITY_DN48758_c1_g1_i1:56-913(-)
MYGLTVFALLSLVGVSGHPCEEAIASACPERPGAEIAACLKDKEQHDTPTEITSECTDFIAVHRACSEEIENSCDEAYFTDDTLLCLTQWIGDSQRSEKCSSVLAWAAPQHDEEAADEGPTDELGMSEKDHQEKLEWQKERKKVRDAAIERMKMKEVDKKKEEDRLALEKFKEEDPAGYAQMMAQQEEEKKQQAAFKRMERQRAAALERKRKQDLGIKEDDDESAKKGSRWTESRGSKKSKNSLTNQIVGFIVVGLLIAGGWFFYNSSGKGGAASTKAGKKGKRR